MPAPPARHDADLGGSRARSSNPLRRSPGRARQTFALGVAGSRSRRTPSCARSSCRRRAWRWTRSTPPVPHRSGLTPASRVRGRHRARALPASDRCVRGLPARARSIVPACRSRTSVSSRSFWSHSWPSQRSVLVPARARHPNQHMPRSPRRRGQSLDRRSARSAAAERQQSASRRPCAPRAWFAAMQRPEFTIQTRRLSAWRRVIRPSPSACMVARTRRSPDGTAFRRDGEQVTARRTTRSPCSSLGPRTPSFRSSSGSWPRATGGSGTTRSTCSRPASTSTTSTSPRSPSATSQRARRPAPARPLRGVPPQPSSRTAATRLLATWPTRRAEARRAPCRAGRPRQDGSLRRGTRFVLRAR